LPPPTGGKAILIDAAVAGARPHSARVTFAFESSDSVVGVFASDQPASSPPPFTAPTLAAVFSDPIGTRR